MVPEETDAMVALASKAIEPPATSNTGLLKKSWALLVLFPTEAPLSSSMSTEEALVTVQFCASLRLFTVPNLAVQGNPGIKFEPINVTKLDGYAAVGEAETMVGSVSTDIVAVSGAPITETVNVPAGVVRCSANVALLLVETVQSCCAPPT